jgi:hypothetical protein
MHTQIKAYVARHGPQREPAPHILVIIKSY